MTQYHALRKFNLRQAPANIRILLTLFSAVMTVALVVGVINFWDKTGLTPGGVVTHLLGNEGKSLAPGQEMAFAKSFRELLDATHPHLFGQGVLLFILCHVVALTGLSDRVKITIYGTGFGAMMLDAAMPWLVRYGSPALAPLQLVSTFALFAAFLVMLGVTVRDLWFVEAVAEAPARERERESVWPDRPGRSAQAGEGRGRRGAREKRRGRREGPAVRDEAARPEGGRNEVRSGESVAARVAGGSVMGGGAAGGSTVSGALPGAVREPRERVDGERRRRVRSGRRRGPRRPGEESGPGDASAAPVGAASTGDES